MFKKYYCNNCKSEFKKTVSNKFIKSVRLECPNCGSQETAEMGMVNTLVNKKG